MNLTHNHPNCHDTNMCTSRNQNHSFSRIFVRSTFLTLVCAVLFGSGCSGNDSKDNTLTESCPEGERLLAGFCICDNASNYYGITGNCQLCEGTGKILKDNACVCDGVNYTDDGSGGCKIIPKCGIHEIVSNGACTCDNASNYYGIPGNCLLCEGTGKVIINNACVCDGVNLYR